MDTAIIFLFTPKAMICWLPPVGGYGIGEVCVWEGGGAGMGGGQGVVVASKGQSPCR